MRTSTPFWEPLKQGTVIVNLGFEHRKDTLFADTVRLREYDEPSAIDLSFDLEKSLRSRSKQSNTYLDAQNLARGEIVELRTFQVDDKQVLNGIERKLQGMDSVPDSWRLHLSLKGDHWFTVRPEHRQSHAYQSLTLVVLSPLEQPPTA